MSTGDPTLIDWVSRGSDTSLRLAKLHGARHATRELGVQVRFLRDGGCPTGHGILLHMPYTCLLYTSDAADEEDSVDLGGRRIIKKKKKKDKHYRSTIREQHENNIYNEDK
eukprot:TRINITY_DN9715_c0_g1_i1.p1 TRINITY_DN9715_c0_g1~~TRINITY_DN9715_c0_g1_i1.p1  ORF type:complete len:111 (-),score=20.84 TRINITY_DN9715_c0_g1_i1:15-347(-)